MAQLDIQQEAQIVTPTDLQELLAMSGQPCVSIYINADTMGNADQGRIRFKEAVKRAQRELGLDEEPGQHEELLRPLRNLIEDDAFWLSQVKRGAVAAFLSPDNVRVRKLLDPMPRDVVVVADTFHVKPLIRLAQDVGRYQLLAVSTHRVTLYEGVRDRLEGVALHPDVPRDMAEALGEPNHPTKTTNDFRNKADSEERDRQIVRYFRRLDEALLQHHHIRTDTDQPMILAALPHYHGYWKMATQNPNYAEDLGIRRDPFKEITLNELGRLAHENFRPLFDRKVADLRERFGNAKAHNHGSDRIEDVARQAVFGAVDTLLIREGYSVGGKVDPGTGQVTFQTIGAPDTDDVIDDIAEIVIRNDGKVLVLPADQMPTDTGIAAILRYEKKL